MRILFAFILSLSFMGFDLLSQVHPVHVEQRDGKWTLLRDGEPYFIEGAGGQVQLDKLVEIGGNTIRTWGTENALEVLDEAHSKGLTVMMGLWVQHERHGFDYDDPVAIRKQLEGFRRDVMRLKDHPALLIWGVGNEVDLQYTNTKVWDAVEQIAAMVKELDPHHPTSTVTAGLDAAEVALVKEKAPSIDIYGINTYGDIAGVKENLRDFGWDGPYMITEWGVNGHWESPNTPFGVAIEQTSHEKAESFKERYQLILDDADYCIGSFAFLWGQKQETTSTWYGLFTPDGRSTEAVDMIQRGFGSEPKNCAPILSTIEIDGKKAVDGVFLTAGDKYPVTIDVMDPEGDELRYRWQVIPESTDKKSGGDKEAAPLGLPGMIRSKNQASTTFRAPNKEGAYRVFVFVEDGKGHAGTANIPFYVLPRPSDAGQARAVQFKERKLDIPERKR